MNYLTITLQCVAATILLIILYPYLKAFVTIYSPRYKALRCFVEASTMPQNIKWKFYTGQRKGLKMMYIKQLYQTACLIELEDDNRLLLFALLQNYIINNLNHHYKMATQASREEQIRKIKRNDLECLGGDHIMTLVKKVRVPNFFWKAGDLVNGVEETVTLFDNVKKSRAHGIIS